MAALNLVADFSFPPSPPAKEKFSFLSRLKLKSNDSEVPPPEAWVEKYTSTDLDTFNILRDFLEPDTTMSLEAATQSIYEIFPENSQCIEIYGFGELCIELVEQIPYHHPSQLKLVRLLEKLGQYSKFNGNFLNETKTGYHYQKFSQLGASTRDNLNGPGPEEPVAFVNYLAFLANLREHHIWETEPTYAIWAMRDGLEEEHDSRAVHDAYVSGAAQWILWNGMGLFQQVMYPGDGREDTRSWSPGPLYDGKPILSLHRWCFWRERFAAISESDGFGDECRDLSRRAATIMDCLEKQLTFQHKAVPGGSEMNEKSL